jgi:hypothetical protein
MTVTIDLKPEIEQGLLAQARERGVSLDAYVQEIVSQQVHSAALGAADGRSLKLPVLHLGDMGSLRRCDIYDDVD